MILLVRQELAKLYRRVTPYVVYLVLAALIALMVHGFKHSPPHWLTHKRMGDMEMVGSPVNGTLICEMVLQSIARLLPFLAPIVAGEILGSEGATGTLRTILVRPRTRTAIWTAKLITAALYTLSLSAVTFLVSLLAGWAVLGRGKLWEITALQNNQVVVLTEAEAVRYLALAYLLLAVAVFVTATLGFMLASFFDNGLLPGFAALGVVLTVSIIAPMDFAWLDTVRPYLFTEQIWKAYSLVPSTFDPHTQALIFPRETMLTVLKICGAYIGVFGLVGWWRFVRRDVTC